MSYINGYKLLGELKSDNSGYAKWGFAEKDGVEVFMKEFLSPIYPLDETVLSKEQIQKKREICEDFARQKRIFYNELNKCAAGCIVNILDFFRNGSRYYVVTEKINTASIAPAEIAKLEQGQKILLIKVILYNIISLHRNGIIHGDIKPTNILLKKTRENVYTAKIIDFDSSFLESNPPANDEEFQGDMVYFAPESFLFIAEECDKLTTKIDIFALGVLFHQYFCGELPYFDHSKYDYAFEAVLDGAGLRVDSSIPEPMRSIITDMLNEDPEKRPSAEKAFAMLSPRTVTPPPPPPPPKPEKPAVATNPFFKRAGDL